MSVSPTKAQKIRDGPTASSGVRLSAAARVNMLPAVIRGVAVVFQDPDVSVLHTSLNANATAEATWNVLGVPLGHEPL